MTKINSKKMLTVLISVAMAFSALAVISFAAEPANATLAPTIIFTPNQLTVAQTGTPTLVSSATGVYNPTIAITNQISDPTSSIVYFFWSTSSSLSGIPTGETSYYEATPPAAGDTYIAAYTVLTPETGSGAPTFTAGDTAYLIATTQSGTPFTSTLGFGEFTVSAYTPTLLLGSSGLHHISAAAGTQLAVSGTGYSETTTSVTIYFNYSGSPVVLGTVGVSSGAIVPNAVVTVPTDLPELSSPGYYAIIALDSTGETAVAALKITPAITVTPVDVTGASGTVLSITGNGFEAGQTISSSSSSIEIPYQSSYVGTSHSAVTVLASGSFSVQVTLLSSIAASPGAQSVVISLSNPSAIETFTQAFYVSSPNPVALGFSFEDTLLQSASAGYPTDTISATVYDFPAGVTVKILLGQTLIGTVSTDSNGYATLPSSAVLPGLPAGSYTAVAEDLSLGLFASQSFTVDSFFTVSDPAGTALTTTNPAVNEYVPNTGNLTVSAYGLSPGTQYTVNDKMTGYSNYQVGNVEPNVVSVSVGTANGKPYYSFTPASNGTLIFTYTASYLKSYSGTALPTGTAASITMTYGSSSTVSGPNYGSGTETFGYLAIGTPDITAPSLLSIYYPGQANNPLTVSNLIPSTATYLYPGVNANYNAYLGSTKLSFVSTATSVSGTITFTVSSSKLTGITDEVLFTVNGQEYYVEATSGTLSQTGPSYSTTLSGTLYEGAPTGTSIGTFIETVSLTTMSFPSPTTISASVSLSGTFTGTNNNGQSIAGSVSATATASSQASGSALTLTSPAVGITSGAAEAFSASAGTATLSFNVLSGQSTGVQNITVVYNGSAIADALATQTVIVSSPSSSPSAGTLIAYPILSSSGSLTGYDVAGYNFDPSLGSPKIYYMGYSGKITAAGYAVTIGSSTGAFAFTTSTDNDIYTLPTVPAGTYSMFVVGSVGTTTYTIYGSYAVPIVFTPVSAGTDSVTNLPYGYINSEVSIAASGLQPYSYYDVYFNGVYQTTVESGSSGSLSSSTSSGAGAGENVFTIPTVNVGTYNMTLNPTGSMTPAATAKIEVSASSTLTMSDSTGYAFPGQIISFSWTPSTATVAPVQPGLVVVNAPSVGSFTYGTIYVTVYLNDTPYTSVPAAYSAPSGTVTLSGSFITPNAALGSYWNVSLGWTQDIYTASSPLVSGSPVSGATMQNTHAMSVTNEAYLGLVQGNGALLTGISQSAIATIEAEINSAVKTSLQVPLSELSANITALHGDIATITTSFGTMTTTLQAINATVGSISSGVVLLQTDIGSMKTSLASLNATIISLNGSIATLSTSLGKIQTTTSAINATVTSMNNGIATVQTSLGTLTGTVTAMNSTIAQVHTTLGTVNANVSTIKTSTTGFTTLEIFLIVAIVLILITLVIAFLAVSSSNKLARKFEEQKKQ